MVVILMELSLTLSAYLLLFLLLKTMWPQSDLDNCTTLWLVIAGFLAHLAPP